MTVNPLVSGVFGLHLHLLSVLELVLTHHAQLMTRVLVVVGVATLVLAHSLILIICNLFGLAVVAILRVLRSD